MSDVSRFDGMRPLHIALGALAVLVAIALPFMVSDYTARLLVVGLISAVAVLGLTIVFGYAGLISLGHAAFVGLGAYTVAILCTRYRVNPWLASACAVAVAGAAAYLIGRVLLRLKGHYLALATLGLNVSFGIVASNWVALTGGTDGIANVPVLELFGVPLASEQRFYGFCLAVLALLAWAAARLRRSHLGRSLIAVRDDEIAASMTGIVVARAKTAAFTIGGVYAAIAGCLFAFHVHFVSPEDFAYAHSITYLAMLIVGGEGTLAGAILGAVGVTLLPEALRGVGNAYLLVFGILVLVVLVVLPKGIVGLLDVLARAPRARRAASPARTGDAS
ncbi:branched-chain amino acid ABC transporter permease [Chitinasiproducens palmae]|uniref:Amino acid/amide ABC transporter membrane protein 2, HAAT family n=1 Tax=Chitinasiproducens palmae TaxID=1770053 RepID=A0A1H2PRF1_9BURK|nr:branched-chain amino acid ABC transporter permease [Chitinasiproducens palmae]SDV49492.1 amino acid/amide ABC transporter membrane protein 2, HAAT family [Chitinasiproducens palmae]